MISFLTPYWSGREMMRIHLASIRRFYPAAPILVSRRGPDDGEMDALRRDFGVRFWVEECEYIDAYLKLLRRCATRYVCILDHDTVLLASLEPFLQGLATGRYDVVGIEERIRLPAAAGAGAWPDSGGWLRFAPGCMASNFIVFDWARFRSQWGLRGILGRPVAGARHFDFDYGIGQKLPRHHYLRPYHSPRYGIGNLLKDGDAPIAWHQWYGSYRTRLARDAAAHVPADAHAQDDALYRIAEAGERAFIADYPDLELDGVSPAWGPDRNARAEQEAIAAEAHSRKRWLRSDAMHRVRRWKSYGLRGLGRRAMARVGRWWLLR